jgi:hypothetical protein
MGDNFTDDTSAINSALSVKGRVYVPPGTYICSGSLNIGSDTILEGDGRTKSILSFSSSGDGIKSTWPINSSTAANNGVRNIGIVCTNTSNTGCGFVDVGGTFVDLDGIMVSGFMYPVVFDQTEIATIAHSDIEQASYTKCGIWIVNGDDHTASANAGFTNRITVQNNQFNAAAGAGPNIVDDGGGCHSIRDNNFNAGSYAIRAAGVSSLIVDGNEIEGHSSSSIYLTDSTAAIGQRGSLSKYVGPCSAPRISGNGITDLALPSHIVIDDCQGGSIVNNLFGQAAQQNILFNNGASSKASSVIIEGNSKLVIGPYRQAAPFVGGFSIALRQNIVRQTAVTYCPNSIASPTTVSVTPATMENIRPNTRLWCINDDGTQGEQVFVTSVTSTSFTAVFTKTKNANFLVYGLNPSDQEEGMWTPTLAGSSTAGSNTYSVQTGFYSRKGNQVFVTATINVASKDAAMAGQLWINGLPFTPSVIPGQENAVCSAMASGWTAAGFTQVNGSFVQNTPYIALMITGSGSALNALSASNITGSTFYVTVSGTYLTNSI